MTATDASGAVDYVVTSMTDVTARHGARLVAGRELQERRRLIETVIATGSITMVFQPIVALDTGRIVGAEALARFGGPADATPDVWFAEAAEVDLGVELELAAIRAALAHLGEMPPQAPTWRSTPPRPPSLRPSWRRCWPPPPRPV